MLSPFNNIYINKNSERLQKTPDTLLQAETESFRDLSKLPLINQAFKDLRMYDTRLKNTEQQFNRTFNVNGANRFLLNHSVDFALNEYKNK